MKTDNDKWSDNLRKRMDGYEEPVDSDMWKSIKRDLDARESVPMRFRRAIIGIAAVAACLIVAVGLYVYFSGDSTRIDLHNGEQLASGQINAVSDNEKSSEDENLKDAVKRNAGKLNSFTAAEYHVASAAVPVVENKKEEAVAGNDVAVASEVTPENIADVEKKNENPRSADKKEQRLSLYDTADADFSNIKDSGRSELHESESDSRWSVSFSAGGNGVDSENEMQEGFKPLQRTSIFGIQQSAPTKGEEDFQYVYNEIVFNNIEQDTRTEVEYDVPITYTASFRYKLNNRWGVDAGLSFSKLGMQWKSGSDTHYYRQKQRMMFIGVPVSVSFTALDTRFVSLYVLGGGSVEKCVSGTVLTYLNDDKSEGVPSNKEKIGEHPWQYSVSAGAGVQFNITKNYGIFAEPKVAWYFDNAEDIDLRKDDGPYFNLNVGLRFTY